MAHHHSTNTSDIAITTKVGPGKSAPKLLNRSLNAGITKIIIIAVMPKATTRIEMG